MPGNGNNKDHEKYRSLLMDNLKFIEERCYRAYGICAGRYGENLTAVNKADSLVVEVMDHLSVDGYRVLRKYKGKSSLKRYLDAVICNKVIDIYRSREGRSRAADEARKMGDAGKRLLQLIRSVPCYDRGRLVFGRPGDVRRDGRTYREQKGPLACRDPGIRRGGRGR